MGSGIAQKSATEGFSVQMVDREEQWVDKGKDTIEKFLQEALERRIFRPEQAEGIKSRIRGVVGHENVSPDTDLVIEAVFEDFELKKEIFSSLDSTCGENTILATNTSSLSVNELAQQVERKDRFVGMHWFYHPAKNRLVEIIPAETTSQETMDAVEQYCKTMGKVIIVCKDRPGFVVNRFFVPWINEACRLLEEGVATAAQIDAVACKEFRIGLGPFGLMNLTGPTIALHSSDYLSEQLSVPRFAGADNMRALVEKGEMWEIDEDGECDEEASRMIKERLMGQAFAVCSQIVEEGICSMEDVDRGAKVGLRWTMGPFELANRIGVTEASRMAMEYADMAGLEIPGWFSGRSDPFEFSYVDVDVDEAGIATVLINRPEAMNALNVTVVGQLGRVMEDLNARSDVNTIVFEGAGEGIRRGCGREVLRRHDRRGLLRQDRGVHQGRAQGPEHDRGLPPHHDRPDHGPRIGRGSGAGAILRLQGGHREDHAQVPRDLDRDLPGSRRHSARHKGLRDRGSALRCPRWQLHGRTHSNSPGLHHPSGRSLRGLAHGQHHSFLRQAGRQVPWQAIRPEPPGIVHVQGFLLRRQHGRDSLRGGPRGIRPGGQERRKTAKVAVQGRPGGRQDRKRSS